MMISKSSLLLFFIFMMVKTGMPLAEELSAMNLRFEQWEISRHGEKLTKIADLTELVRLWSENNDKIIEMRYPGGEEGELWVQELMDWLVALGVPSSHMHAVPGSGNEDIIKIILVQGKKTNE